MQKLNDKTDKVIIRHVTNAVPAGNLAVITGDGFKNARVFANKLGASSDIIKAALKAGKNIEDMTVEELKALAKEKGLTGVSSLAKADLLAILKG